MGLTASRVVSGQDFRDISSTKQMAIGSYQETKDGRGYRYVRAGGTALDPGKIVVAATVDSNHSNESVAVAASAGVKEVSVAIAGTIAANAYDDGYLTINDAAGEGITYQINSHTAFTGSGTVVVRLADPIEVALTTSSEATLTKNPWADVVISVADQADLCVGVPNVTVTAAYFGWVQTKGMCSVLADEAVAAGLDLTIGSSTVGAVEAADAAGEQVIGTCIHAAVDTEYHSVYLKID
jgi:hypothetical protein